MNDNSNKCQGCRNYTYFNPEYKEMECHHTYKGIKALIDCSCASCLLKTICREPCHQVRADYENSMKRFNKMRKAKDTLRSTTL